MTDNILAGVKTKPVAAKPAAPARQVPSHHAPPPQGPRVVEEYGRQNDAGDTPTKGLYRNGILQTGKPKRMR